MAAASTKRYAEGNPLSFVDGIPVAVKGEYHVVSFSQDCLFSQCISLVRFFRKLLGNLAKYNQP